MKWWLIWGRYRWSRWRRRLFERRYAGVALPAAYTLGDIASLLDQVAWTMDGPLHMYDAISYPGAVWAKKRDDCDGFAVLAAALLERWGASSEPSLVTVMLRPVRQSHTVCVFREGGDLRFFDNARLNEGVYKTYAQVVEKVAERGSRLVCWDVVHPETLTAREFHRVIKQH